MNTDIIIKTFIHHKYKTLLNIIIICLLSFFIYSNLNLQSKQERLIFYFGFNNFANIILNDDVISMDPRNEFGRQLISYRNYIFWTDTLETMPTWNYKNFLSFKFEDDKIVISNIMNEKIINEIIDYIEFTSFRVNKLFTSLIRLGNIKREIQSNKQKIDNNNNECTKKIDLYLDENIDQLMNKFLIEEKLNVDIKKCLENDYNNNYSLENNNKILENEYSIIMNSVTSNQIQNNNNSIINNLDIINIVEIFDIKKEVVSINNLKAINLFTFTAFMLIIGLIFQFGFISFYYKNSSK